MSQVAFNNPLLLAVLLPWLVFLFVIIILVYALPFMILLLLTIQFSYSLVPLLLRPPALPSSRPPPTISLAVCVSVMWLP